MTRVGTWAVQPGWRRRLTDLGLHPTHVLRRAGLPDDLFNRRDARLSTPEYFRLWRALDDEAADPLLPIRFGQAISTEVFDPPLFAALCSPDLNTALTRIAAYRRLVSPMVLHVKVREVSTLLQLEWPGANEPPPPPLAATELIFFVKLARMSTRTEIRPLGVGTTFPLSPSEAYSEFFGVAATREPRLAIRFSATDAERPFLTAAAGLWQSFEPELRRRLADLKPDASTKERVRSALLELLPSGDATINGVSTKLGTSTRTLQRHLKREGKAFQQVLDATREKLAFHYLTNSRLSAAEISFLLAYSDPNSFYRAFHDWTGNTPERTRLGLRSGSEFTLETGPA